MIRFLAASMVLTALAVAVVAQTQTASTRVSGTVFDEASGQPLKGALVRVAVNSQAISTATLSDTSGEFVLEGVPVGNLVLTATKVGYLRPRWKVGQLLQSVTAVAGVPVTGVRLPLRRGGTISGSVSRGARAELPGATVSLTRCAGLDPCDLAHARVLPASATTDDRGRYRFSGLPEGSYFVVVNATLSGSGQAIEVPAAEEIRQAAAQLASRGASTLPVGQRQAVTPLTTFFPGTTDPLRALAIDLGDGEDRSGVNVAAQMGTAARISGSVVGIDGRPADVGLSIFPTQRGTWFTSSTRVPGPPGMFVTDALPPGEYRIAGRVGSDLFVAEEFRVNGQNVENVTLRLRPTLEARGRVVLESAGSVPLPDPIGLVVTLRRSDLAVTVSTLDVSTATTSEGGAFEVKGLTPGLYSVSSSFPNRPGERWSLKSVVVGERNVTDSSFEVTDGEAKSITVTLTNRETEIAGVVRDGSGRPAPEYTVIAFATDSTLWTVGSRRVITSPTLPNGTFTLRGLPPGDYFVGLIGTNDPNEIDRGVLAEVSKSAPKATIVEGETKRLDLTVARTP